MLKVPLNGELPPHLRVGLNEKLRVGQLEVEPVKVGLERITVVQQLGKNDQEEKPFASRPSLLLHLKLRNTSTDVTFHPADPAFSRMRRDGEPLPGCGLEVGPQRFWGGLLSWPRTSTVVTKQYVKGQDEDATPLGPGETHETVIPATRDPACVDAVKKFKGTIVWRVQLRHGLAKVGEKDVPVTAVVGVEFQPEQVEGGG